MKKVDNFDASKWLVENKITFQSRLNEGMAKEKMYEVTVTHKITKESSHVWVIATSEEEARKNVENSGMKMEDYYISSVAELYSEDLDESRLNENKIPGVDVEVDDDMITLSGDSGDYDGFIEDDGTVSFTVTNDEEEFDDNNWKSILGKKHVFVKIANAIDTKVEALGDYVMITVKASDLTSMNESKLNEDLTSQIAALPNHHTAENTEEATLVVGKYAVVHYDESDEGGENMYVVWDNTVNQDEIGSYDDEPEFESTNPAEVAAFLKKNESLNEVERERFLTDEQKADIIEFMNYGIGALQQLKQDRMAFGKKMFEKYGTDSYKSIFSSMFGGLTSMIADTKRNVSGIKGGNHDYK